MPEYGGGNAEPNPSCGPKLIPVGSWPEYISRSGEGAGVEALNDASEKSPLTSSMDHQVPAAESTTTTVGLPRANASARAVRRVARKSPVAEAKLPRVFIRFRATADMPARMA